MAYNHKHIFTHNGVKIVTHYAVFNATYQIRFVVPYGTAIKCGKWFNNIICIETHNGVNGKYVVATYVVQDDLYDVRLPKYVIEDTFEKMFKLR